MLDLIAMLKPIVLTNHSHCFRQVHAKFAYWTGTMVYYCGDAIWFPLFFITFLIFFCQRMNKKKIDYNEKEAYSQRLSYESFAKITHRLTFYSNWSTLFNPQTYVTCSTADSHNYYYFISRQSIFFILFFVFNWITSLISSLRNYPKSNDGYSFDNIYIIYLLWYSYRYFKLLSTSKSHAPFSCLTNGIKCYGI